MPWHNLEHRVAAPRETGIDPDHDMRRCPGTLAGGATESFRTEHKFVWYWLGGPGARLSGVGFPVF